MLNVNWGKIHSIILCHLSWLRKLPPTHTHPLKTIHEFLKPYGWVGHTYMRGGVGHTWDQVGHAGRQHKN